MAEFTVNAQRINPYLNFKFRLKWDGQYVAGVSKCSALIRTTQVVKHRDGALPSTPLLSPGQTEFKPITLERGVTYDLAFEAWAATVWQVNASLGAEVSLKNFRKNLRLEFYNEAGQLAIAYTIQRAWVSEYQALPELDASGNAVAIQRLVLENEGWFRDTATVEQPEVNYSSTAA
jgi:phage tail-like protein